MDADWLQEQLESFTCPACSQPYRGSEMRLLAERDGLYFLDLDCQGCGSQTVAIVTVEMDDAEASIADLSIVPQRLPPADLPVPGASVVSADDVLEMHEFLARFDGNVSHLLRSATGQPPGRSNHT
jgi:hypothetical protein